MQSMAVPTAAFGPCIDDLPLGWEYQHQEAESGRARFWLDSDRLGDRFVEISLTAACDTSNAFHTADPRPGIEALSEGPLTVESVPVAVVSRSEASRDYATTIGVEVSGRLVRGRPVDVRLDISDRPIDERLARARSAGEFILVVGMTEEVRETVELIRPGSDSSSIRPLDEAIEDIEDDVDEPRYRGSWYFEFEGGCIEWAFDAKGEGVGTLSEDIGAAIDFFDLAALREAGLETGFLIE
jgi:hypothetical protein